MALTTYSIHAAYDHSIVATATPADLQQVIQTVAQTHTSDTDSTQRFYVHNGLGVVGAFLARNGAGRDILRDGYRQFDVKARELRTAKDLPND